MNMLIFFAESRDSVKVHLYILYFLSFCLSQVNESEGEEDEAADKVVELLHSPSSVRSATSPALNGDADDVFLFDNNIPSIATRIPTSAEPAETLALRRRNRLLRLISDPRVYSRDLQRSVSVQLDDRRRQHHNSSEDLLGTSWPNGELDDHMSLRLTPPKSLDDDSHDSDDAEVGRQQQDGRGHQSHQSRGRATENRSALTTGSGGVRRKNLISVDPKVISVDACCSVGSEATWMKRRGTLKGGKVVVADDLSSDDEKAELSCNLCNGLDDQPKQNSSTSDCSNNAN